MPETALTPQDLQRFWSKVAIRGSDECWPWTAGRHKWGYGRFWLRGRNWGAHQVAALIAHGPRPAGLYALHGCDNPPCCNPAHVRYGTPGDNMRDRDTRGNGACGERQGLARLTAHAVRAMRADHAAGVGTPELGRRFGVHTATAHRVVTRQTWRHVA